MTGRRGIRRKQLLEKIKGKEGHWKLKKEALDSCLRRTRFAEGNGPVVRQTAELIHQLTLWPWSWTITV